MMVARMARQETRKDSTSLELKVYEYQSQPKSIVNHNVNEKDMSNANCFPKTPTYTSAHQHLSPMHKKDSCMGGQVRK